MKRYTVMFCCNDERGASRGRVEQVEIADEITLVHVGARQPMITFGDDFVRLSRHSFTCRDHQSCVGNIFWDSVSMDVDTACLLVDQLLRAGWRVDQWAEDSPFSSYARKAVAS